MNASSSTKATVNAARLLAEIKRVESACGVHGTSGFSDYQDSVLFEAVEAHGSIDLVLSATDGCRLHAASATCGHLSTDTRTRIVWRRMLTQSGRSRLSKRLAPLAKRGESVEVCAADCDRLTIDGETYDGEDVYDAEASPLWRPHTPQRSATLASVTTSALASTLRALRCSAPKSELARLSLCEADEIAVRVEGDMGGGFDAVDARIEGQRSTLTIGASLGLLIDACAMFAASPRLLLGVCGPLDAIVMSSASIGGLALVMPMRVPS